MRITTYAVTYKLKVKAVLTTPSTSYIPFYYKRGLGSLFCPGAGPIFRKFGSITAHELFQNQNEFQDLGNFIQFTRDSELSYIGETVEMHKEETKLPPGL